MIPMHYQSSMMIFTLFAVGFWIALWSERAKPGSGWGRAVCTKHAVFWVIMLALVGGVIVFWFGTEFMPGGQHHV